MLQFVPLVVIFLMMFYAYIHGKLRHDQRARIIFALGGGAIGGLLVVVMVDREWSGLALIGPFLTASLGIWIAGGMGMRSYRRNL